MAARKKPLKSNRQKRRRAEVLNLLAQTLSIDVVARLAKTSASAVYRYQQRLVKMGLLTRERELTQKGFEFVKKFLMVSRIVKKSKSNKVRLHNVSFTVNLIKKPVDWDNRRRKVMRIKQCTYKAWNLKGWTATCFYVDNIEVRTSPRSVILNFPDIYGSTPLSATNKVVKILNGVIPKLEGLFRVVLARPEYCNINLSSGHYALTNNEVAKLFLENGWKLRVVDAEGNLRLIVDDSKGLRELEAVDKRYSEDDSQQIKDYLTDLMLNKNSKLPSELTSDVEGLQPKIDSLIELTKGGLNAQQTVQQFAVMLAKTQGDVLKLTQSMAEFIKPRKSKRLFTKPLKKSATVRGVN